MRARLVILVAAILLVAGFAAMNWSEFLRTAPLSLGWRVAEAPLGLILLGLLVITLLALLASSAVQQADILVESRHLSKRLQGQRELAEHAEASRFTELRTQLEQMNRTLNTRLDEFEARIDARLGERVEIA